MKYCYRILLALLLPLAVNAAEIKEIQINQKNIQVEIADTDQERELGLMYRKTLPAEAGMLFKFDNAMPVCMWMKNTYIPLSVAFIDSNGTIINIEKMHPLTENIHCSKRAAKYALEMNQGWFEKNKIKEGDKVAKLN